MERAADAFFLRRREQVSVRTDDWPCAAETDASALSRASALIPPLRYRRFRRSVPAKSRSPKPSAVTFDLSFSSVPQRSTSCVHNPTPLTLSIFFEIWLPSNFFGTEYPPPLRGRGWNRGRRRGQPLGVSCVLAYDDVLVSTDSSAPCMHPCLAPVPYLLLYLTSFEYIPSHPHPYDVQA